MNAREREIYGVDERMMRSKGGRIVDVNGDDDEGI